MLASPGKAPRYPLNNLQGDYHLKINDVMSGEGTSDSFFFSYFQF